MPRFAAFAAFAAAASPLARAALTADCELALSAAVTTGCIVAPLQPIASPTSCKTSAECTAIPVNGAPPPPPPPPAIADNTPCMPARATCGIPGFNQPPTCTGTTNDAGTACVLTADATACAGTSDAAGDCVFAQGVCNDLVGCLWDFTKTGAAACAHRALPRSADHRSTPAHSLTPLAAVQQVHRIHAGRLRRARRLRLGRTQTAHPRHWTACGPDRPR